MPELRYNLVTTEWVILATERAKRPEDFQKGRKMPDALPSKLDTCPFCPGNEHMTPPEVLRIGDGPGWDIRAVPNKFSALSPEGERHRSVHGTQRAMSGIGLHQVVIETPRHDLTTSLLDPEQIEKVLLAYRTIYNEMSKDERIEMVIIFKNHGEGAGTSLAHPHSQIIGIPLVPVQIRSRMDEMAKYHDIYDTCIICDIIEEEKQDGKRIVVETDSFLAFIPFAALSPFHLWIFPKRHATCFSQISEAELKDLSRLLKDILSRIYIGLSNPDYNYVIRSCPIKEKLIPYFHWYLSIIPRVTRVAGFELGSGIYINTALPEDSARFLREVKLS